MVHLWPIWFVADIVVSLELHATEEAETMTSADRVCPNVQVVKLRVQCKRHTYLFKVEVYLQVCICLFYFLSVIRVVLYNEIL